MIISEKRGFVFFHLYKAAGTSIRAVLRPYKDVHYGFESHSMPKDFIDKLGMETYNKLFTFSFVRNPWDWQVSLYHYMLQNRGHYQYNTIKNMNFSEYIDWRVENDLRTQYSLLSVNKDNESEIKMDFIGKVENIDSDFDKIKQKLDIDGVIPHSNQSKHKPFREYYDDNTKKIVEEAFKIDIDYFDYSFDKNNK